MTRVVSWRVACEWHAYAVLEHTNKTKNSSIIPEILVVISFHEPCKNKTVVAKKKKKNVARLSKNTSKRI